MIREWYKDLNPTTRRRVDEIWVILLGLAFVAAFTKWIINAYISGFRGV